MLKKIVKDWGPEGLWLLLIVVESTGALSAARTGAWLWQIATACFATVDRKHFELVHLLLRKLGHFSGYAILCLLIFRALHASLKRAWSVVPLAGPSCLAVSATFLVACLDEYHQSQVPSRSGAFRDVLLDSAEPSRVVAFLLWRRDSACHSSSEIMITNSLAAATQPAFVHTASDQVTTRSSVSGYVGISPE